MSFFEYQRKLYQLELWMGPSPECHPGAPTVWALSLGVPG